jgi:ABC-type multidrug transport system ATPase subunit
MAVIIKADNLTKQFKDLTAVNNLSFTVNEGDVYGFLGQNGAGKSTTIRMLLSLITPTSGEINIFEKNLFTHRSEILRQLGAVIEKPDLYKYLTAYDNLRIFARISGVHVTQNLLMHQLEAVGLAARAHSKVKDFSQGMKQRLGIAVALIHNPKLIVLDEPTNGLDPQGIADIRHLILQLSKEMGKTVVVSSHLLSELEIIANRIIIIDKGKKIVEGNAKDLLDPAKTIVEVDTLDNVKARLQLQQTKWSQLLLPTTNALRLQADKTAIPQLVEDLVAAGIPILAVNTRNTLEEYFLSLTTQPQHAHPASN